MKYYYHILREENRSFKYPPNKIKKIPINLAKLLKMKSMIKSKNKLHIGCGDIKLIGFINIDNYRTNATDLSCKIEDLPKYIPSNSIKMIYICHTLEHFSKNDSINVLKMFYDFLEPGGELRISVPDLCKLASIIKSQKLTFENQRLIQGILAGGQDTKYNYHKSIYWSGLLQSILGEIGFKDIAEYPCYPHFMGDIKDASSTAGTVEFGKLISLNIMAIK